MILTRLAAMAIIFTGFQGGVLGVPNPQVHTDGIKCRRAETDAVLWNVQDLQPHLDLYNTEHPDAPMTLEYLSWGLDVAVNAGHLDPHSMELSLHDLDKRDEYTTCLACCAPLLTAGGGRFCKIAATAAYFGCIAFCSGLNAGTGC